MLLLHILSVVGFITGILCIFAGIKAPASKITNYLGCAYRYVQQQQV